MLQVFFGRVNPWPCDVRGRPGGPCCSDVGRSVSPWRGKANGADEKAEPSLLVREDFLDGGAYGGLVRRRACAVGFDRLQLREGTPLYPGRKREAKAQAI
jgi:hypothetical protein